MLKTSKKVLGVALAASMLATGLVGLPLNVQAKSTVEITWLGSGQPQEKQAYEQVIKRFEKSHPNVKIKYVVMSAGEQYNIKIKAAMASGNMPDIFYINPENVKSWVGSGKVLNLSKYVKKSDVNNIWKPAISKYRFDGKNVGKGDLYALPKDVGPFAFAYNKTMFKKAGIPLPDKDKPYTWKQWIDISKKLTKDTNGDGKLDQWSTGLNVNWSLAPFVWSNGADWLNASKNKVTITDPKFEEALQFFVDMTNKYKITPDAKTAATMDTYQRWLKGQEAFFPAGPWDISVFNKLPFDYDLMPWPAGSTGKTATWLGSLGFAVSKTTQHAKEAVEFAMYLSTEKAGQKLVSDLNIQIPNIVDMATTDYLKRKDKPDNKKEFIQIAQDYGRSWPYEYTYTREWYDEFYVGIQAVLDGKVSVKQYCKTEQPKMQKLLDKSIELEKQRLGK